MGSRVRQVPKDVSCHEDDNDEKPEIVPIEYINSNHLCKCRTSCVQKSLSLPNIIFFPRYLAASRRHPFLLDKALPSLLNAQHLNYAISDRPAALHADRIPCLGAATYSQ